MSRDNTPTTRTTATIKRYSPGGAFQVGLNHAGNGAERYESRI
jgi:hypothetical protein